MEAAAIGEEAFAACKVRGFAIDTRRVVAFAQPWILAPV